MLDMLSTYRQDMLGAPGDGATDMPLLVTTGANPTFDPSIGRSGGVAPSWDFGDGNTAASTDSPSHSYSAAGTYYVTWDMPDPSVVVTFDCRTDDVTALHVDGAFTGLRFFYPSFNNLTLLKTYGEWTVLDNFQCDSNDLVTIETHPEWTVIKAFFCHNNSISGTVVTHPEWAVVNFVYCQNNSIDVVEAHEEWTAISDFRCFNNNLSASVIDDILIALDATGAINGTLAYQTNPGSADIERSTAAATAKTNLAGKGWTITN